MVRDVVDVFGLCNELARRERVDEVPREDVFERCGFVLVSEPVVLDARGASTIARRECNERQGGDHKPIETYFVSRKASMPSVPPSLPRPDSLKPPNGA